MKKRNRDRQRSRLGALAPKGAMTPDGAARSKARSLGWLAGIGLALLIGFPLVRSRRLPPGSDPAGDTSLRDRPTAATRPGGAVDAGATNRPGAVMDRQKEGLAADLNNQAKRLLKGGDAKGAVQVYKQALALTPEDEVLHLSLGLAYFRGGDSTNAEHEYKEALRLVPDYPEAHHSLGNLLLRSGRLAEAEEQLKEAVNQMPESALFQNSLGILRQRQKQTSEAFECFQKAVECDTNCWEAHFNLGKAYLARNNREKGIGELQAALRIVPGFEPAERALASVTGQTNAPGGPAN